MYTQTNDHKTMASTHAVRGVSRLLFRLTLNGLLFCVVICLGQPTFAQSITPTDILALSRQKSHQVDLEFFGFTLKYGGARKEGGWLYRYTKRKTHEEFWIYSDENNTITSMTYVTASSKRTQQFMTLLAKTPSIKNDRLLKFYKESSVQILILKHRSN